VVARDHAVAHDAEGCNCPPAKRARVDLSFAADLPDGLSFRGRPSKSCQEGHGKRRGHPRQQGQHASRACQPLEPEAKDLAAKQLAKLAARKAAKKAAEAAAPAGVKPKPASAPPPALPPETPKQLRDGAGGLPAQTDGGGGLFAAGCRPDGKVQLWCTGASQLLYTATQDSPPTGGLSSWTPVPDLPSGLSRNAR
jgi:hypothetical protein